MSEQDRIFLKNFALVLAGLMVFTLVIIVIAWNLNDLANRPPDPSRDAIIAQRVAPVGDVYTGGDDPSARPQPLAAAPPPPKAPFGGSLDGGLIYAEVCAACHTQGVAGAPRLVASAWEERLAKGTDTLVRHAIEGYQGSAGYMPPRGGRTDLTDAQVRASVEWMIDRLE